MARQQGFRFGIGGPHSSRTLMLADLAQLFEHGPADGGRAACRRAILEDNLLGKRTVSGRRKVFERLSALYLLDESKAMYRGLRWYWRQATDSRPVLALLTALARDPLFRATAPQVLGLPLGAVYDAAAVAESVAASAPGRFKPQVLRKIATNAGASWTQAGYLQGRSGKRRVRPVLTPGATAYALFLGSLEGRSGAQLFATLWVAALDHPRSDVEAMAQEASARRLLTYRRAGSVIDIDFRCLEDGHVQG